VLGIKIASNMSWNPLRKLSRQSSRPGGSQSDDDLERCVASLNETENGTKKLIRDVNKLTDSILAVNRFEKKMTEDISTSALPQENDDLKAQIEEWHTFSCEVAQIGEDLALNLHKILIGPLKKYQSACHEVKQGVKKRENMVANCQKLSQKVSKYETKEKTGQNVVKLETTKNNLSKAQEELQEQTELLLQEVPLFVEKRIEYFQPSLEGLIRSEVIFWGDMVKSFGTHESMIANKDLDPVQIATNQQNRMQQISNLIITSGQTATE